MTAAIGHKGRRLERKRGGRKCLGRKRSGPDGPGGKVVVVATAAWRAVRVARKIRHLARRTKLVKRRNRGASRRGDVGKLRAVSVGSIALGSFALGASAFGAVAVGAVAIRRLAIKRAAIRRLDVHRVKVGRLEVDELVVHSDRRPPNVPLTDKP